MKTNLHQAITFSRPEVAPNELAYLKQVGEIGTPWGGNSFYEKAVELLGIITKSREVFLTQSCSAALELAAIGLDIQPGDEVICPSFTFVTTVSAFTMRGAKPVFVDVNLPNMLINVQQVEQRISKKTKAIVAVHYGGVPCDLNSLRDLADRHGVFLIEDAAQGMDSFYGAHHLGTFGHLGTLSFHGTKNLSSGEGGALLINERTPDAVRNRIAIAHEKGTNRNAFLRGAVDKYTWRGPGSSFIPSEYTSALLLSQLEYASQIKERRETDWQKYSQQMKVKNLPWFSPIDKTEDGGNAHMFAGFLPAGLNRSQILQIMRENAVYATSHYEPLHLSPYVSETWGNQTQLHTTEEMSQRLIRFPLWSAEGLDTDRVIEVFTSALERVVP
jgi:dTDP-4-amino-4,6-dideoxygalactose transaminase